MTVKILKSFQQVFCEISCDLKLPFQNRKNYEQKATDIKHVLHAFESLQRCLTYFKNHTNMSIKTKLFILWLHNIYWHAYTHSEKWFSSFIKSIKKNVSKRWLKEGNTQYSTEIKTIPCEAVKVIPKKSPRQWTQSLFGKIKILKLSKQVFVYLKNYCNWSYKFISRTYTPTAENDEKIIARESYFFC